jgi:hypothetical protein
MPQISIPVRSSVLFAVEKSEFPILEIFFSRQQGTQGLARSFSPIIDHGMPEEKRGASLFRKAR